MKVIFTLLICLMSLAAFAQYKRLHDYSSFILSSKKITEDTSSYIKVIYDSVSNSDNIVFRYASPNVLLDTLAKYHNCTIKYGVHGTPLVCTGNLPLEFGTVDLLYMICERFKWYLNNDSKNIFTIREPTIYFRDLLLYNPYTADLIKCDSPYKKIEYDTVRKYFVINFKGVSPFDILNMQAEKNGYIIEYDNSVKPLEMVSGILPLYLDAKNLVYHFCILHQLYYYTEGKKYIITSHEVLE